jgi:biotin operon repressor
MERSLPWSLDRFDRHGHSREEHVDMSQLTAAADIYLRKALDFFAWRKGHDKTETTQGGDTIGSSPLQRGMAAEEMWKSVEEIERWGYKVKWAPCLHNYYYLAGTTRYGHWI